MEDSVTVFMKAPTDAIWQLLSDITQIGRYSPETFEAEWVDNAAGPVQGAAFRGHVRRNGRGPTYWTTCHVLRSVPGEEFTFGVGSAGRPLNTWGYMLQPADGGTNVTEFFRLTPTLGMRIYWSLLGWSRGRTNRRGMQTTLERIRDVVEQPIDQA